MLAPAANSVAPLAVLVLVWDEATPAVRLVVEAPPAPATSPDSIAVLVPRPDEPTTLSTEEYLPLPVASGPLARPPAAATAPLAPTAEATLAVSPGATGPQPAPLASSPTLPASISGAAAPATSSTAPTVPAWAAVRVLHLSALPPAPIWTGPAQVPAAPYAGASVAPASPPAPTAEVVETAIEIPPTELAPLPLAPPASPPAVPLLYTPAEEPALAPDPEADERPTATEKLASLETLPALLAPALPPLPQEPAPAPASPPAATAPPPTAPPAAPTRAASTDEQQPVAQQYPAANLNFQIIQYARFAVPRALAEAPFQAVYAPEWPTWLAAQELHQRTGQPLVLHVAVLAAAAGELLDTAVGWAAELQRQALHRADLVLTETEALALRIRHELGLAAATVRAVPAADAAAVAQALHTARPRPSAKQATFVGDDGI